MADEGGVSAALLDIADRKERKLRYPGTPRRGRKWAWIAAATVGAAFLVGLGCVALGLVQIKGVTLS